MDCQWKCCRDPCCITHKRCLPHVTRGFCCWTGKGETGPWLHVRMSKVLHCQAIAAAQCCTVRLPVNPSCSFIPCLPSFSHPTLQEALAKHASGAISNHPLKLRDMLKEWQERCKETAEDEQAAA